jgi:hypothetical protein
MAPTYRFFAPWILVISGLLLIAAVLAAQDFEFTTRAALAYAAASFGVVAISAAAALLVPNARTFVLRRALVEPSDRESLLATAWVHGAVAICLALWAAAR